jgi:hypothetical protein
MPGTGLLPVRRGRWHRMSVECRFCSGIAVYILLRTCRSVSLIHTLYVQISFESSYSCLRSEVSFYCIVSPFLWNARLAITPPWGAMYCYFPVSASGDDVLRETLIVCKFLSLFFFCIMRRH